MTCGKMLSWNKFSTCATWYYAMTKRLGDEISKFVITKFYLSLPKPESSNSSATPPPSKLGSKMHTTGVFHLPPLSNPAYVLADTALATSTTDKLWRR
jgi:hypothetical protein